MAAAAAAVSSVAAASTAFVPFIPFLSKNFAAASAIRRSLLLLLLLLLALLLLILLLLLLVFCLLAMLVGLLLLILLLLLLLLVLLLLLLLLLLLPLPLRCSSVIFAAVPAVAATFLRRTLVRLIYDGRARSLHQFLNYSYCSFCFLFFICVVFLSTYMQTRKQPHTFVVTQHRYFH